MIVTFWVVFALTLVLAIGGIWDTSGDQATKGLARFYGILMLPCLAAGLLVFLLAKAPPLRIVAVVLAGAPLLLACALMFVTVVAERAGDYQETARYVFTNTQGQAFGDAIERGDLARIRGLVAQGIDPNVPGHHGEIPLRCSGPAHGFSSLSRPGRLLDHRHAPGAVAVCPRQEVFSSRPSQRLTVPWAGS